MQAGETASYNGYEYALFPMDYMNCSQRGRPGDMSSYSHCCTYACDWTDPSTPYPVYAPFSGTLVNTGATNGRCYYYSDNKVWTPQCGLTYVSLELVHDNTPPASGHYNQGDLIYHTGNAGNVTGPHVHLDQSNRANQTIHAAGYACTGSSTPSCWTLPDTQPPYKIFYVTGSETVINLRGMTFEQVQATPTTLSKILLILLMAKAKERRKRNGRNTRIV